MTQRELTDTSQLLGSSAEFGGLHGECVMSSAPREETDEVSSPADPASFGRGSSRTKVAGEGPTVGASARVDGSQMERVASQVPAAEASSDSLLAGSFKGSVKEECNSGSASSRAGYSQ
jgi:hypothetical protein